MSTTRHRPCPRRRPRLGSILAIAVGVLTALASVSQAQVPGTAESATAEPGTAEPAAVAQTPAFSVDVRGDGDRHVILIPGLGSPGAIWDATVEALVSDGFHTHAVTLAGFAGQPPLQPSPGPGEFLPRVHEALLDYARTLNARPALVGHSLGATLSLWLASSTPDLFGPVVAVDGVPFLPALTVPGATPASTRIRAESLHTMISGMAPEAYDRQTAFTLSTMVSDPEEARRVTSISLGSDPASIAEAMRDLMTRDLRPQLAAITSPVLMIGAGAPATTPEALAELEARYRAQIATAPNHRVQILPGARHFVMVDEPAHFLALIREHLGPEKAAKATAGR